MNKLREEAVALNGYQSNAVGNKANNKATFAFTPSDFLAWYVAEAQLSTCKMQRIRFQFLNKLRKSKKKEIHTN